MGAKRVFEGLTLVTVGVILLANTTGVLPWSVWLTIFMLWPLLLVSLGIDILGRALNSTLLRVLASIVVIAGLVYGALAGGGRVAVPVFGRTGQPFSYSQQGTAETGDAKISGGLTRLTLRGGTALASAEGESPFGKPRFSATTSGGKATVDIATVDGEGSWGLGGSTRSFLDTTLSSSVVWQRVRVSAGVSEVKLDLRDIPWRELRIDNGMSTTDVDFGDLSLQVSGALEQGAVPRKATISGGLSTYTLRVPSSVGVELRVDNGLGSVKVPSGWTRVSGDGLFSGTWRSAGYDAAASKLLVDVSTGLSSVSVETY